MYRTCLVPLVDTKSLSLFHTHRQRKDYQNFKSWSPVSSPSYRTLCDAIQKDASYPEQVVIKSAQFLTEAYEYKALLLDVDSVPSGMVDV